MKKRKRVDHSLYKHFFFVSRPPKKKNERDNKKENEVKIATLTSQSKRSYTLAVLHYAEAHRSDTDETSTGINRNVEMMKFSCVFIKLLLFQLRHR